MVLLAKGHLNMAAAGVTLPSYTQPWDWHHTKTEVTEVTLD